MGAILSIRYRVRFPTWETRKGLFLASPLCDGTPARQLLPHEIPVEVPLDRDRRANNIAAAWGGVSGGALKGNPDTRFVYKAPPSAHGAILLRNLRRLVFRSHPQLPPDTLPYAAGVRDQPSSLFLQLGRPSSLGLTVAHFSSPQLGPARPSCLSSVQLAPARSSYPDTAYIPSSSTRYGRKWVVRRRCSIGFGRFPNLNPS